MRATWSSKIRFAHLIYLTSQILDIKSWELFYLLFSPRHSMVSFISSKRMSQGVLYGTTQLLLPACRTQLDDSVQSEIIFFRCDKYLAIKATQSSYQSYKRCWTAVPVYACTLYRLNNMEFTHRRSSRGNYKISLSMFSFHSFSVWGFVP
jgi:hypothetical protein